MKRNVKVLLAIAAIVAAFGVVGSMDYRDEVREQLSYCENVKNGVWPDFKEWGETECRPERIAELENILR
ncbi:hypothetical protein PM396_gp47 [Xanthomonas phage vB_Xar_IVIA-DoCa1]|jgi:hypothetical protein|uniref:Uncharacterized protein n=2 Tax=Septimatrevirus TaxID=1921544 RepID=A0A976SGV3_9CAUD|nr:hypothetical protein AVV50_gp55 [Pseudomonas phage PaMx42]YP_010597557.1 hypothetical protein PM395_gp34 [Xanthomonas phage Samson]YP_010597605.1 hypothetical protein PM396_gp47 [Xanthomonas phage vB_Xar_IVIA-DoCa1]WID30677.1 hypothetical protein [Pseudomonas phage HMGUpa1]ALH23546.1 hypothetical protein PaMx42_55 [Pseudomonas phage PaMx42]QEG09372.1 hypothetical protein Samson_057 [Xanthomonas phage Samson]UVB02970.1 hypothetical protein IVIADoCa1_47 [Xanthomonas phage vB_Xar_IVIA-DoCa1]